MLLLLQSASVAGTLFVAASDTTNLTLTDDDVTEFSSELYDSFSISLTEVASPSVAVSRNETANLRLVEVSTVTAVAPTDIAGTDDIRISVTDASVLDVAIDVTDDTDLTLSGETGGTPDVLEDAIAGTDDIGIAVTDQGSVEARDFNEVDYADEDDAALMLEDAASIAKHYPVSRARFALGQWSIKFRIRK